MFLITIPHYYEQVHIALHPQLANKSFAIIKNNKIWVASSFAQKFGVFSSMPISEAKKKDPYIKIEKYRGTQYRLFSQQFKKIIRSQCKKVRLISPYTLYADSNSSPFAEKLLAEHVHTVLNKDLEMDIRIGGGLTESIAFAASELTTSKEPIIFVTSANKQTLQQLPIGCLQGIGKRTALLLSGIGITTIKQFATSPVSFIRSLFGEKGEVLYQIANTMRLSDEHSYMQKNAQQMTIPL